MATVAHGLSTPVGEVRRMPLGYLARMLPLAQQMIAGAAGRRAGR